MSTHEPDLSKMEQIRCPDCDRPWVLERADNTYKLRCSGCDRRTFDLPPKFLAYGQEGGLLFLYRYPERSEGTDHEDWRLWIRGFWGFLLKRLFPQDREL